MCIIPMLYKSAGFILSIAHEKVNINQIETINAYINGF